MGFRDLAASNTNYDIKRGELINNGGVEASTDILVPFVTNRDKYPDAPKHLPKYILMNETKILELKDTETILKYENPTESLTILLLCEPWRAFQDFDIF